MRHLHSVALAGGVALAATPVRPSRLRWSHSTPLFRSRSDAANVQPGGAFSAFDISFADPVTGDIYIADRSNAAVDIFSGIQPDVSRTGDRIYRAAGDNVGFRPGWRFDGHLGRGHDALRR